MRIQSLLSSLSVLFLVACSSPEQKSLVDNNRPNILFIMADDHTSQAIGSYNLRLSDIAPTPNIDRLATEGAILRNVFCTNSICVPSRASILTGQYSHMNGVRTLDDSLDPRKENVAKKLQATGYQTALIGKWHLKNQPSGFDYFNILRGQGDYNNPTLFENSSDFESGGIKYPGHSTDVITDLSLQWLKNRESNEKPFMLMCHYKAVHEPFYSHDRFRELYDSLEIPEPKDLFWPESPEGKRFQGWPMEILTQRYIKQKARYPPPNLEINSEDPIQIRKATYQKFIKDYMRAVAGIDENVGRLLDYLDESGQYDNTIVIYTSDQGYFLGEHNLFDKRFMLEESMRMPFLIRYPEEIEPGSQIDDIILNVDFSDLIIDYAGANSLPDMQGRSFRQNLKGMTPADWRKSMYYHYWTHQKERPSHYGIRSERFKLIYYYGLVGMDSKEEDSWELYDLKNDPNEYYNKFEDPNFSDTIEALKQELVQLRLELQDISNPLSK